MTPFDLLSPDAVLSAVEETYSLILEPVVEPYPSYINRVFALKDRDGQNWVAKFYRPGRWSLRSLEEEQDFLEACAEAEVPTVVPELDPQGFSLGKLSLGEGPEKVDFYFSLSPKSAGRVFDAEGEEDWLRLGRLAGRIHRVSSRASFRFRPVQDPRLLEVQIKELIPLVHPDLRLEFTGVADSGLDIIRGLFVGCRYIRLHGDLHRGNILDRGPTGLQVMDFDDCMTGVPVQDLWLLLPGAVNECSREVELLSRGYSEFADSRDLDWDLVEPLRFMRMIHFLVWCARQREDQAFSRNFPGWGTRSFWIREVEDLKDQLRRFIRD